MTSFQIAKPENNEGLEWKRKTDTAWFLTARNGDMLSAPFQCDCCWFSNLTHKIPNVMFHSDARLLAYIRRVNLDILWSREPSTVGSTYRTLKKAKTMSNELGLLPVHIAVGPWPLSDTCGFQVALEILRASQQPGRNTVAYTQFDSIRKIRSAYINALESAPARCLDNWTMKTDRGQILSFLDGQTKSKLFTSFMKGCERQMGRFVKQDLGLSLPILLELLNRYAQELDEEEVSVERKRFVIITAAAFVILWAGALRGGEVFMLESSELVKRRDDGRNLTGNGHVVIPLMGCFKGETGERNLIIVLANRSSGGLEIRRWVDLLSALLLVEGRGSTVGPALCDKDGNMIESRRLNEEFHMALEKIQQLSDLIPDDLDVAGKFNLYRSFRRGATTRARERKVPNPIIEMNNCWRKIKNRQGSLPRLPMTELYTEISQVLDTKLSFSLAL